MNNVGEIWIINSSNRIRVQCQYRIPCNCHYQRWPVSLSHYDVIKWKHFPRNWPFVRGIHWSAVNSPHKGQWRGALMFSLICVWINDWVNNRDAGDLKRYRAHYDVIVMNPGFCAWLPSRRSNAPWPFDDYVVTKRIHHGDVINLIYLTTCSSKTPGAVPITSNINGNNIRNDHAATDIKWIEKYK